MLYENISDLYRIKCKDYNIYLHLLYLWFIIRLIVEKKLEVGDKMVITSFVNVKGGVGKTTSAINVGGELIRRGYRVLFIDNDSQSSLSQIMKKEDEEFTMYELYSIPRVGFDDCISKISENLYIIPNKIQSAILETELNNRMSREVVLRNKLDTLTEKFDWVLIDNSPFLGLCVQNSLAISDNIIEVIDNSPSALQGLRMVKKLVLEMEDNLVFKDLKLLGVLRNRFDKVTRFSKQISEVLEDNLGENLFDTIIYDSVKYKESVTMNRVIQEYSKSHSKPYKKLVDEMIDRIDRGLNPLNMQDI